MKKSVLVSYIHAMAAAAVAFVLSMVWALPHAAANEGIFLTGYDTVELQRAASGVASPRNASWMFLNPGALTALDRRIDANFYTVFTDIDLKPRGIIGNRIDSPLESNDIFFVPSGGLVWPTESGAFAAGLYVPSGSGVDYQNSRNLISRLLQGNRDRRLEYQHARLIGAYAKEFDNGWSVGAAIHGSISRFRADHITLRLRPTMGDLEWETQPGIGVGVGVYKEWDKWSFGASYISRNFVRRFEDYGDLLENRLDLPHIIQAGFAWRPADKLELNADYKWLDWDNIDLFGAQVLEGGFSWRDQHSVKFGAEYTPVKRLALRAGYSFATSPVENEHVFVTSLVPVITKHNLTAGGSWRVNEHHEFHLTYLRAVPHTQTDTGTGDIFSIVAANSELRTAGNSFSLGYTLHF